MDSLSCDGVKCHRLILVTDLEHGILNGSIVQTEGKLLQIAPAPRAIEVIQVGIDSVVPEHGREGRSLAKPLRRQFCQERRHEVIVALDVKATGTLRRNARAAITGYSCQQR